MTIPAPATYFVAFALFGAVAVYAVMLAVLDRRMMKRRK